MDLELYVLPWGIYPRRVLIYLSEKGLLDSPHLKITPVTMSSAGMVAPGKPSGTVPILALGNGTFIKQSIAILEYIEDICDDAKSGEKVVNDSFGSGAKGSMRGETAEERARMRDILGLADEASLQFGFACHKGSALFTSLEPQSPLAARFAMESCKRNLQLVEQYFEGELRFERGGGVATIADCVLFSLLQFAKEFYAVDLTLDLPNLARFYDLFKQRRSAKIEEDFYPAEFKILAGQWIGELNAE